MKKKTTKVTLDYNAKAWLTFEPSARIREDDSCFKFVKTYPDYESRRYKATEWFSIEDIREILMEMEDVQRRSQHPR